jgi:DMSO/TMAO reductase YedYZ molybdopterin-dependent catalytic subunit
MGIVSPGFTGWWRSLGGRPVSSTGPAHWRWPTRTAATPTNLPLEDLLDVAYRYDGENLAPEHGGPALPLVPYLYFRKSATWVHGIQLLAEDSPVGDVVKPRDPVGDRFVWRATDRRAASRPNAFG